MHAYWVQSCDLMVEISEECYRLQTTTAAGVHVLVVPSVLLSGHWCLEQESLTVPSDQWLVVLLNGLWHFDQNPRAATPNQLSIDARVLVMPAALSNRH